MTKIAALLASALMLLLATAPASAEDAAADCTSALKPELAMWPQADAEKFCAEARADLTADATPQKITARAWSMVAIGFHEGASGLPRDEARAVEFCIRAADQGDIVAQVNLGSLYANGRCGLPKDAVKAAELYRLAADQGDPEAQFLLGAMYCKGEGGLPKDEARAREWFKKADPQGDRQCP